MTFLNYFHIPQLNIEYITSDISWYNRKYYLPPPRSKQEIMTLNTFSWVFMILKRNELIEQPLWVESYTFQILEWEKCFCCCCMLLKVIWNAVSMTKLQPKIITLYLHCWWFDCVLNYVLAYTPLPVQFNLHPKMRIKKL